MTTLLRAEGWFLGSFALLAGITAADVVTPTSSLAAACAVAPFLASATCSTSRTVIVTAVAMVVAFSLLLTNDQDGLSNGVLAGVLAISAVLAPFVAHVRADRERQIRDLARVARVAQDAVLTPVPETAGPLRLASAYESASREALIGGDLFAVATTGRETRLIVGDVRGKGVDAVKTAAEVLAIFREAAHEWGTLSEVAASCHAKLQPRLADEDFVTALFASIDDSGRTELVSYGHPAPLLASGGALSPLDIPEPAGPLGLALDPGRAGSSTLQLTPGDRLLFYTDGLAEARDRQGAFLEVSNLAADLGSGDFEDALPRVLARLHSTAERIDDDLAMLLVEFVAEPGTEVGTRQAS